MELKKGETIMIDVALHLPAYFLHEAFSNRSGVPLHYFELYYWGTRLEGEAALMNWGVEKDSTIEVKMRGRGGVDNTDTINRGNEDAEGSSRAFQVDRGVQSGGVEKAADPVAKPITARKSGGKVDANTETGSLVSNAVGGAGSLMAAGIVNASLGLWRWLCKAIAGAAITLGEGSDVEPLAPPLQPSNDNGQALHTSLKAAAAMKAAAREGGHTEEVTEAAGAAELEKAFSKLKANRAKAKAEQVVDFSSFVLAKAKVKTPNTFKALKELRKLLREYKVDKFRKELEIDGFVKDGKLTTDSNPFNVFARIGAGKIIQSDMKSSNKLIGKAKDRFVVCSNKPECDENWQSNASEWKGYASMSKRHRLMTVHAHSQTRFLWSTL